MLLLKFLFLGLPGPSGVSGPVGDKGNYILMWF